MGMVQDHSLKALVYSNGEKNGKAVKGKGSEIE